MANPAKTSAEAIGRKSRPSDSVTYRCYLLGMHGHSHTKFLTFHSRPKQIFDVPFQTKGIFDPSLNPSSIILEALSDGAHRGRRGTLCFNPSFNDNSVYLIGLSEGTLSDMVSQNYA